MRIGIAGWSNPPSHKTSRRASQTHLEYYAEHFSCVEINTSFYRPHKRATYSAWKLATPAEFSFSVKMPRTITHDSGLLDAGEELTQFYEAIEALQPKLGAVLIQMPPSLEFDARRVRAFFRSIPKLRDVKLVCEPRHPSWFTRAADTLLAGSDVARVAAHPTAIVGADKPGGNGGCAYFRWHGSPHKYYSSYSDEALSCLAAEFCQFDSRTSWCIFDNTARFAAWNDAQRLRSFCVTLRDAAG